MAFDITGIPTIADAINGILGKFFTDKNQIEKDSAAVAMQQLVLQAAAASDAAGIVKAEAQSGNWLTSSWRPLTMLFFVFLIGCRVFGWTSANVTPAEYQQLWELVKLGLGGYVIGRTVEKTAGPMLGAVVTAVKAK
jgi:hypothetical protein